jgi:hypothetical protein
MVSQPFGAGGNQSYPEYWAVTGDLQYPEDKTPTVALEPSVKGVGENVLLMGGKIGIHMLLRALLWDSAVRFWG